MSDTNTSEKTNHNQVDTAQISINNIARQVLADYLKLNKPGYALLIDAPWGAGKTYFVKRETDCDNNEDRLYVSLYGVATSEEFEWAIVRALKPYTKSPTSEWIKQAKNFTSAISITGFSLDLNKVSLTEIALLSLPDTLIFDDIERCKIKHDELLGLLNRFVEHQSKRIILIANSEKIPKKSAFTKQREKLIGRTIRIEADIDAAIVGIWGDMAKGDGKKYLRSHQKILIKTFHDAGHNNLRLFRQSLMDAARFIDVIDKELRDNTAPMEMLLRTYLALTMAFAGGKINIDDLNQRKDYKVFSTPKDNAKITPIHKISNRHPDCDIQGYHNSILPPRLACELIGSGYSPPERINQMLRGTYHFANKEKTPDWLRLWKFVDETEDDLKALLETIDTKLDQNEITVPGQLLQIFGAKAFIQELGGLQVTKEELTKAFILIIKRLSDKHLLPPKKPTSSLRGGYGFEIFDGTVNYGGVSFKIDEQTRSVVEAIQSAQDAQFELDLPQHAQKMLCYLKKDPAKFCGMLDYNNNEISFSQTPILHLIPHNKFASAMLQTFRSDSEGAIKIFECLHNRRVSHQNKYINEQEWFSDIAVELQKQADKQSPLLSAQIKLLIKRFFN